jgi:hypothetical protein
VRLGGVREFDNDEHTFYVEVLDTAPLDRARGRLYDGAHAALPLLKEWTWHVTCIRNSRRCDPHELRVHAQKLTLDAPWMVDTVSFMELRGDRSKPLATWHVDTPMGAADPHPSAWLPPRE